METADTRHATADPDDRTCGEWHLSHGAPRRRAMGRRLGVDRIVSIALRAQHAKMEKTERCILVGPVRGPAPESLPVDRETGSSSSSVQRVLPRKSAFTDAGRNKSH